MAARLRQFTPFKPSEIINIYGDWIILIFLCGIFITIAQTFLPERITSKRSGKLLSVFIGLSMGVGLYSAKKAYNFNFESFGFLGIALIVILLAIITFSITSMKMKKSHAVALTYCVMFLTFYLMTPSIYDSFARSLPILNLLFVIAGIYFIMSGIFGSLITPKSTMTSATDLAHADIHPQDESYIDKEIDAEKKERKQIKSKTIKLTKRELKDIDHIHNSLKDIEKILKDSDSITEQSKNEIAYTLVEIRNTKNDFLKGLNLLKQHAKHYRARDQNRIQELRSRYHSIKDELKRHKIKKEVHLEQKKLQIFEFINSNYDKITKFINDFDTQVQKAVIYIKENQPKGAIHPIQTARNHMNMVWHMLKEMKQHEQYLLKLSKKEEKILKKEKKGK